MRLNYRIAGIGIKAEVPYDLTVQEESIPFLAEDASGEVEMVFIKERQLPSPASDGIWKMNRLYCRGGDPEKVFYYPAVGEPPYALVSRGKGEIRVFYTEASIPYINYSHNLIDLLSLETLLLEHGGLIVHASFICWKGMGILFTAPSGTGKSTQARLWMQYEQADCLNGDRTGLRKADDIWRACGLPYAGSSGIYRNESAPLAAVAVLRQGKENRAVRMNPADAFRAIYPETLIHQWDSRFVGTATGYLAELVADVPCFLLTCRPDAGAVRALKEQLDALPRGDTPEGSIGR